MKKYNLINNSLGWACFFIAAITYLLTLEPTASFWDCPEFISQGYKLEVGHPPGNPIFMLAARFFVTFAGGDPSNVAVAVNVMSALLSAGTILLLFWTITHLVRRLMVGRSKDAISWMKTAIIMGSGVCGALMYTWSDTFWFSAVEGEVYAFSSFCTALVFWLILKWDNRADQPHSDRYLILIAYIIGISIAVHLLNLLTIPALGLVVYYRLNSAPTLKGSLLALVASFALVAIILYGLVPGFIEIAGYFEIFCVNTLGMSYNMGVLFYALLLVSVIVWCVFALYRQKSLWQIRTSFILSVILSGIPFVGSSLLAPILIIGALVWYVCFRKQLSVRLLTIAALSILVIFVGYSSYALLLIRSSANPPMNQNSPDNVFSLASYLNREQYGDTPLFYGPSFASIPEGVVDINSGAIDYRTSEDGTDYVKAVKENPSDPDRYVEVPSSPKYNMTPNMIFPRMYSQQPGHPEGYMRWIGESRESLPTVEVTPYYTPTGEVFNYYGQPYKEKVAKPSFGQNLRYFFTYQLNHMYWRYFMWNFAGRQNDLQGNGELTRGNWISGIPFIDNSRLGDQSLLPPDIGSDNAGHNVFYMLPLLMGLLGIALQMVRGREGVEQFWVVFFLFFMTGIAIVLYLNQPPNQPRERDYAFAGSFYAFAIWVGMGVYGLWLAIRACCGKKRLADQRVLKAATVAALIVAIAVPLQVVSQTWDDHDRSGRYTTRDFGMNYLSSVDENGIIFTNGDNDTFPLWYAQEVEGYRTDVRVVNLAYLATDWYANQVRVPSYDGAGVPMMATPADYAYNRLQINYVDSDSTVTVPVDVFSSLRDLYKSPTAVGGKNLRVMRYPLMYIPLSVEDAVNGDVISSKDAELADDFIQVDLSGNTGGVTLSQVLSLDMIASGIQDGWKRPAYFAMTVPDDYYLGLTPYLRNTGLTYQVTPVYNADSDGYSIPANIDKMYDIVTKKFRWGGLDQLGDNGKIYLDETVRRMVTTHRSAMFDLATGLYNRGLEIEYANPEQPDLEAAKEYYIKSLEILDLIYEKLPSRVSPYALQMGQYIGNLYCVLGSVLEDSDAVSRGLEIIEGEIMRYAAYIPYLNSLIDDENDRLASIRNYRLNAASVGEINITATERYIPQYLYLLLDEYSSDGGDLEALAAKLDNQNIDINDLSILLGYQDQ